MQEELLRGTLNRIKRIRQRKRRNKNEQEGKGIKLDN